MAGGLGCDILDWCTEAAPPKDLHAQRHTAMCSRSHYIKATHRAVKAVGTACRMLGIQWAGSLPTISSSCNKRSAKLNANMESSLSAYTSSGELHNP